MSNSELDIQCVRTSQFLTVLDEQEVIYITKDSIYTFTYLFNNFIYLLIFAVSLLLLGLLVAVAPLIAECGLLGFSTVALGLQSTGSVAVVRGLSCSVARGIFLDQGSNLCLLHCQADSEPPGKPPVVIFKCIFFKAVCSNFYYSNSIDGKCEGLLRSPNLRTTDLDP